MRWIAILFVLGLLTMSAHVHATGGIISPLADETALPVYLVNKPAVGFQDLTKAIPDAEVLGVQTETTSPPAKITAPSQTRKKSYTISLLGDSMIDTLGPDGGGLAQKLNKNYPNVNFSVINHGVGAENIDSGLRRLTNGYSYLGTGRISVVSEKPDIIVIESFGYNPYPLPDMTDALNKHWMKLSEITDTIHRDLPETKIVIAATIAPNWDTFGDGAPFINFSPEGKRMKVEEIKKYIEGAIGFAKSQGLPLANAYTPSLDGNGNGKLMYINGGDHIHYSDAGRNLMAQKIAGAITSNGLLE